MRTKTDVMHLFLPHFGLKDLKEALSVKLTAEDKADPVTLFAEIREKIHNVRSEAPKELDAAPNLDSVDALEVDDVIDAATSRTSVVTTVSSSQSVPVPDAGRGVHKY